MRVKILFSKIFLPVFILFCLLFSSWLMFHTFSYNNQTHEIRMAFKLWSDFAAHIPLIRSFSMGPNYDRLITGQMIEYPIFPGEPMRFHFIFDMVVGLLEKAGLRIDWALNIPSILGFTLLLIGIYLLANKLFQSKPVAVLSVIFFLFNGSLGFLHFFQKHPLSWNSWQDIMNVKEFPAFAPWGPGDITAFWNLNIYTNQRHLAGAFALILFFILTCLRVEHKPSIRWAVVWSILVGILPYYHQPTLLIMAVVMLTYFFVFPKLRRFLFATGVWSLILIVPQLLISRGGSIEWYPGYIIHNEIYDLHFLEKIGRMIIFWWNNLGLHSVLIVLGFFFIPTQAKKVMLPIIPIFLIGNLLKFSIEASANHKFFNFVLILGAMISAYTLISVIRFVKKFHLIIRLFVYSFISLFLILLTLSGIIDFFVVKNDIIGTLNDIHGSETNQWIALHTPKDAIFLTPGYMYQPPSFAGRSIFLGWPYFVWSAGYKTDRMPILKKIYESRDFVDRCTLLKKHNISYMAVEQVSKDQDLPMIDYAYYKKTFHPSFVNNANTFAIYSLDDLCTNVK